MNQTIYRGRTNTLLNPVISQSWLENTAARRELNHLNEHLNDSKGVTNLSNQRQDTFESILKLQEQVLSRPSNTNLTTILNKELFNPGNYSVATICYRNQLEAVDAGSMEDQVSFQRVLPAPGSKDEPSDSQ